MEAERLSILDHIDEFNLEQASIEKWDGWLKQFHILLRATNFENLPDSQKVALLLLKCRCFLTVLDALEVDDETVSFDDLVSKLTLYMKPLNARNVFFNRKQGEDESFEHFAEGLVTLSLPCRFLDNKIVRDMFLFNMDPKHSEIKRMIMTKHDPTLEEAVLIASAEIGVQRSGSIPNGVQGSLNVDASPPRSSPWMTYGPSSPAPASIRMMPCNKGVHEVQVLHVSAGDEMVYVCPTPMVNVRQGFLDSFNLEMKKCTDSAELPVLGLYAALVSSTWYRVRVIGIEEGQKARVISCDFGWMKTVPFTVIRKLPPEFRVAEGLTWAVSFRRIPQIVQPGTILRLKITQYENNWKAELSNGRVGDSETRQNVQPRKNLENNKIPSSASDGAMGDHHQQRKSLEGRSNFQQRRSLDQEETTQGRNGAKQHGHGAGLKRRGRGSREIPANSDSDNAGGTSKDSDIETCETLAKDSKPRSGRSDRNRNSLQDESKISHSFKNLSIRGMNENLTRPQDSNAQPSKSFHSSQSSEDHSAESKNTGPKGIVRGHQRSAVARNYSKDVIEPVLPSQPAFIPRAVEQKQVRGTSDIDCSSKHPIQPFRLPPADTCPIPQNCYTRVRIMHEAQGGTLSCIPLNLEEELEALCEDLAKLGETETLTNPREGDLCLARDGEFFAPFRATITKMHPSGLKSKVRFIDVGNVEKRDVSQLQKLPNKYWDIPPYSFRIQVVDGKSVKEGDEVDVMPTTRLLNEEETWGVKVRLHDLKEPPTPQMNRQPAAAQPPLKSASPQTLPRKSVSPQTLKPSSDRSRIVDHPKRPRPPPIPRNTFSKVIMLYIGREGIFGIDKAKAAILAELQEKLHEITLQPLEGPPEVDSLCVAPFDEEGLYRARISGVLSNNQSCQVTFVDFGNETEIPIRDLKRLPDELSSHVYTFKLRLDPQSSVQPKVGDELDMTPVVLQADGSWLVQLKGEPTSLGDALPEDNEIGPF